MKILAVTNVNGRILDLQKKAIDNQADWVLCVGNFGAWPDPKFVDRATKEKGVGDFPKLYTDPDWYAEVPVLFISGPNENHKWLHKRSLSGDTQVLQNIHWLGQGYSTVIGGPSKDGYTEVKIAGLGKVYSDQTYAGKYGKKSFRHYTRREVERACGQGMVDLLLTYEGIKGQTYGAITSRAEGIDSIVFATRPVLHLHYGYGAEHSSKELNGTTTSIALSKNKDVLIDWEGRSIVGFRLID